ncbi:sigma-70 family RNA polymerase sigma factor [Roseomonas sp. CECT 9278]|uniref:sigma-70 family RNA polymerase sigma factor n=1 Tax=Roseomonas sp. CECT 9278 TaxID=2845823 RepID=UPI001E437AE6|nr:sigma-70 family RNA polymerase sigma factor [Roseomonas sp. CECT 9278]
MSTINDTLPVTGASVARFSFHDELVALLPKLRVQALSLTRNRTEADDLVQAAVANALAAQASFTPGTHLGAWVYRILKNRFISDRRRRRETVEMDDAPADAFARSGNQEDSIALGELRREMARLPEDQRIALVMVAVQGMSYEEVAEATGCAVGTAKCRVFRARRALEARLMGEPTAKAARAAQASRQNAGVNRVAARSMGVGDRQPAASTGYDGPA